jgi:glycosyltransferase involved in cell wall biosynthesis
MNLLHVNAAYPPFVGGAETYARTISERCVANGQAVTLVTTNAAEVEYFWNPRKRHVDPGRETVNGVDVIRCSVSHLPFAPLSFYVLRRMATLLARWPHSSPALRHLTPHMPGVPHLAATLNQLPGAFDLVHGINIAVEWPLLAAWRYARQRQLPFAATPFVHVGEQSRQDVLINYVMPHQLEALRDADAVIVQTGIERQVLIELGIPEDRLHRLGMGVNLAELQGGDAQRFRARYGLNDLIVTFLGVVTRDKGSFDLVHALEQLWAQGLQAHLVIGGQPVDEFNRFFKRLPMETQQRIIRLGVVAGRDKQDLLAATDVLALPSRIDSFGIVYLEAWAYGKPVIGGRAGGVPDVIDDQIDGLLVDFGNVPQLAGAIQRLLSDRARAVEMGARGRAKVERFYTWDRIHGLLTAIYHDLVSRRMR